MKHIITIALCGLGSLTLAGCGSSGHSTDHHSTHRTSSVPSPRSDRWTQTFSDDSETQWRCINHTLLIREHQNYGPTGLTALHNDPRCGGNAAA